MGLIEVLIPFIPRLTYSWLWEKSVYIAVTISTIYHWDKPHGFCEKVNSAGYDYQGVFYCL